MELPMRRLVLCIVIVVLAIGLSAIGLSGERYAQEALEYYQRGDYRSAIRLFNDANDAAGGNRPEFFYWIGTANIALHNSESAKFWLNEYLESGDLRFRDQAQTYLEIIDMQSLIFEKVSIRKMPAYINSRNSDFGAVTDSEGKYLYFTSLRPARREKENIWRSERLNTGWGRPEFIDEWNTDGNESIGSFSRDGRIAYLFGNYERGKIDGDLCQSTLNRRWGKPSPITELSTPKTETQPMVYEDSLMFFVSAREGGYGGTDIWVSVLEGDQWGDPINLGTRINSTGNEQTPFLDYDSRTLFFASNGHPGLGGYDLFKSVRLDEGWTKWSVPENLGIPTNSIGTDRSFYRIKHTNEAFISSDRDVEGFENLYTINVVYAPREHVEFDEDTGEKIVIPLEEDMDLEKRMLPEDERPPRQYIVFSGRVTDQEKVPLETQIHFVYRMGRIRFQRTVESDPAGLYEISLPYAPIYAVVVNKAGFLPYRDDLELQRGILAYRYDITLERGIADDIDIARVLTDDDELVRDYVTFVGSISDETGRAIAAPIHFIYRIGRIRFERTANSGDDGQFEICLPYTSTYTVVVSLDDYLPFSKEVELERDQRQFRLDIVLVSGVADVADIDAIMADERQMIEFYGIVTDEDGKPMGVDIEFSYIIDNNRFVEVTSSSAETGKFRFLLPVVNRYTVIVDQEGFFQFRRVLEITAGVKTQELNIVLKRLIEEKVFIFDDIQFKFDSAELLLASMPILNQIVLTLLNNPEIKVEISGHTCNIGTAEYNLGLSRRRAESVRQYLVSKGIDRAHLTSVGYGLTRPVADNRTLEGKIRNRRVEVKVIK